MKHIRQAFDGFYDLIKPAVFWATQKDPEIAHTLFIDFCRFLHATKLEKAVLDNPSNLKKSDIIISNAAGFNKNGEIHPEVIKYLGFDENKVGTVTADQWNGNPRPRCKRFPKTETLVNWYGLPGLGVDRVADRIYQQGSQDIPLTVSVMATPGKTGQEAIWDIEKTMRTIAGLPVIKGVELNISCPNTYTKGQIDSRKHYEQQAKSMIEVVHRFLSPYQSLDLKVSPDLTPEGVCQTIEIALPYVKRIVTANTTTKHDPRYIPISPGKGGGSGDVVYDPSLKTQKAFYREISARNLPLELVSCGGINTTARIEERRAAGAKEIQVYTPFIFKGPRLLRGFREYLSS